MRREVELGFHSEWGCLLLHVPTAGPSDSVILFHTAVERARCRLHKLLHTGGSPPPLRLLFGWWLTVSSVFTGRSTGTSYS